MKGTITALHKSGDYQGKNWYQISVMETGKQYAKKGITSDDPTGYLGKKDELDIVCTETPTDKPNPHKSGQNLVNRSFILPNNPNIHIAGEQAQQQAPQQAQPQNKPVATIEQFAETLQNMVKRIDDALMHLDLRIRELEKNKSPRQLPPDIEDDAPPSSDGIPF